VERAGGIVRKSAPAARPDGNSPAWGRIRPMPSRDEILLEYIDRLPFSPYPVQEEALYAWAACDQGVLMSAPTGTGKTLVAEAAVYEGLRTGKAVYYSTPLIALTDQKLIELQDTVERWGYRRDQVGLVTGNRTVNPDAPVKVVVAEVLLNRLLHQSAFDFTDVGAVVMDEFHNFNDPQRGIVCRRTCG
jgi:superfamily II RNA helicase